MKRIIITGSRGMIARELIEQLNKGDVTIICADIKNDVPVDLRNFNYCLQLCEGADEVYHLMGVKGNPKMTSERPVDFMGPMLQCDTNMILAAQIHGVKKFLYTSSIAVENPDSDKYPAWAKQTAETLIEAMRIQYPKGTKYCVVRPANVYGRYDNFSNPDAMVITSLIRKALDNEELEVWGDGREVRSFINAKDVAGGMIKTMKKMPNFPINLTGPQASIKNVAEIIRDSIGKEIKIKYNLSKASGKKSRVMASNGLLVGFKPKISLEDGIKEVIEWVKQKS